MKLSKKDKDRIKKHGYLLKTISSVGMKRRNHILKNAPKSLFPVVQMLAKHLVKGGIPLTVKQRKKLTPPVKTLLRKLHASKGVQKTITQNGTGFMKVLRFILPIVGPLLSAI